MNKNLDVDVLKDFYKQTSDFNLPVLLEIYNPDIKWDSDEYEQEDCYLRVISSDCKVKYKNKTWLPCAFVFTPPDSDGQKIGSSQISINAVDARVKFLLRMIRTASEASIIAMFEKIEKTDSNGFIYKYIPLKDLNFTMDSASLSGTTATFNLTFKSPLQQNIPFDIATQDRVRGAVQ